MSNDFLDLRSGKNLAVTLGFDEGEEVHSNAVDRNSFVRSDWKLDFTSAAALKPPRPRRAALLLRTNCNSSAAKSAPGSPAPGRDDRSETQAITFKRIMPAGISRWRDQGRRPRPAWWRKVIPIQNQMHETGPFEVGFPKDLAGGAVQRDGRSFDSYKNHVVLGIFRSR